MKLVINCVIGFLMVGTFRAGVMATEDPIVAKVNGKEILQSEIVRAKELLPERYRNEPIGLMFPGLLRSVIDSYLAEEYARAKGMHNGAEYKADIKRIERQVLQRLALKKVINEEVTEEALKARFQKLKMVSSGREEIRARHILLKSREAAAEVIGLLDQGGDFKQLAKKKSIGPSGSSGGDLGFFGRGQMVPAFEKAAFDLESGVYTSEPIKTQFGWHVILNEGSRKSEPISFEDTKERLRDQLTQEVVTNLMDELRRAAKIKKYNFDGTLLDGENKK